MTIKNLLSNGYFSEELPPAFSSELLGAKAIKVLSIISSLSKVEEKKLHETDFVRFSIPKVGIHRRHNGIPNPFHFIKLSEVLYKNWRKINMHYRKSKLSASIPEIDKTGKRAIIQFSKYEKFREKCIECSYDKFFELRADISKYFASIYTHSIPWAIHTKVIAKTRRRDQTLYGNVVDEFVRYGQSGQTIGIPIGTDTSRIIAELIGCSIDIALVNELKIENVEIKGNRFLDDCHFFFNSQAEAEKALKHFQKILGDFSLNINEEKTSINQAPFLFENVWNHQIITFKIRFDAQYQRLDLRNYFNLLINLSKQFPNESVIKYGVKKYGRFIINISNWNLYESLLYSLVIAEGAILPDVLSILLQNKKVINRKKLESLLSSLLNQHIYKGNHFEVAWALWIARSFKIKISKILAQSIIESKDIISIIILLDLRQMKLVPSINISTLLLEFNQDGLVNEYWLLVYEACHKGWIQSSALSSICFFKELSNNEISFYDNTKQVDISKSNIYGSRTDNIKKPKVGSKATTTKKATKKNKESKFITLYE